MICSPAAGTAGTARLMQDNQAGWLSRAHSQPEILQGYYSQAFNARRSLFFSTRGRARRQVIHPKGLNSKGLNSKGLDLKRLKLKRIQAKGLNLKRLRNQKDSSASIQPHSDLSVKTSDYQHTRPGRRPRAATCAAALRHPALPKIITIITIITATTTMHSALGAIK